MSINLFILCLTISILIILFMVYLSRKNKIRIKYALVWIILFALLCISMLIPGFLEFFTKLFGFQTPSNMILSIFIILLMLINISSVISLSKHNKKIDTLTKEIALLEKKLNDKK